MGSNRAARKVMRPNLSVNAAHPRVFVRASVAGYLARQAARAMAWRHYFMLLTLLFAFALSLYFARQAVGLFSPWFALLAMFSILGVAAFSQPLLGLSLVEVVGNVYPILHLRLIRGRIERLGRRLALIRAMRPNLMVNRTRRHLL